MTTETGTTSIISRYGTELIIVFVGVYAAFWVDNWRDQKAREERTKQVIETLRQDLADAARVGEMFDAQIESGLAEWQAARSRGELISPYVLRISRSETPPMSTWEAVIRSDLVELLEPNLVFDLGFFYSENAGVGQKYVRYATFTDTQVLPGRLRGDAWFYDQGSGELKPEFAAHMDRLREYQQEVRQLTEWGRCLYDRLAPGAGITDSCRPQFGDIQ